MRNSIINWKGSLRRCLPQIRAASDSAISAHGSAQAAAEQVHGVSLGAALEKERRKYRFKVFIRGRQRGYRGSGGTSTKLRSRRRINQRVMQRAKRNLEVPKCQSGGASNLEPALEDTSENTKQGPFQAPTKMENKVTSEPQYSTSAVHSFDGGSNSVPARYSLMHVAELPVYWGQSTNKHSQHLYKQSSESKSLHRKQPEYEHVGPLQAVSNRRTSRKSRSIGGDPAHNPRIEHRKLAVGGQRTKNLSLAPNPSIVRPRIGSKRAIQPSMSWKTLQSLGHTQTPAGSFISSTTKSLISEASRTTSHKRAIDRFARSLEAHLQAYQAHPKESLLRSPPSTTISAYTIEELKPYQADFQAAGLAVTSSEQRRKLVNIQRAPAPPPTPMKVKFQTQILDFKTSPEGRPLNLLEASLEASTLSIRGGKKPEKSKSKLPSSASGSTGTTVLGFTPPHEKSYPRLYSHKRLSSASDHTIVGFAPPYERMPQWQSMALPPAPKTPTKTPTKRILPWLQKKESSPTPPPRSSMISAAPTKPEPSRPLSPLGGWVSNSPNVRASRAPAGTSQQRYVHEGEPFRETMEPRKQETTPAKRKCIIVLVLMPHLNSFSSESKYRHSWQSGWTRKRNRNFVNTQK